MEKHLYTHVYFCSYESQEAESSWMSTNWFMDDENILHLHNGISFIHKQK